jgi:hypothetical protein
MTATLRAELIALTVNQRMDETIRGPIEVADEYLKVFREWLGSEDVFTGIGNAMADHGAKVRTMQDNGFIVGIDLEYAAIAGALSSLTEASE